MKRTYIFNLIFLLSCSLYAQNIQGKWISLDDSGTQTAIINVYEDSNIFYAKILDVLDKEKRKKICTKCLGKNLNQPIIGLVVIENLKFNKTKYTGGYLLDYNTGKVSNCSVFYSEAEPNMLKIETTDIVEFKTNDSLKVKTIYWKRMVL